MTCDIKISMSWHPYFHYTESHMYICTLNIYFSTVSPVVEATMSTVLEGDTRVETYTVEVKCDIRPSSTADYCEVIAHNDDSTVSGNVYTLYL